MRFHLQNSLSARLEYVSDPVKHVMQSDGHVIDLAMMKAAFFAAEDFQRLLP
jgi:hypothetical protein